MLLVEGLKTKFQRDIEFSVIGYRIKPNLEVAKSSCKENKSE